MISFSDQVLIRNRDFSSKWRDGATEVVAASQVCVVPSFPVFNYLSTYKSHVPFDSLSPQSLSQISTHNSILFNSNSYLPQWRIFIFSDPWRLKMQTRESRESSGQIVLHLNHPTITFTARWFKSSRKHESLSCYRDGETSQKSVFPEF